MEKENCITGKPHTNKIPGHWNAILRKAIEQAKRPDVEKVFVNKGLSRAKKGAGRNRPDVTVVKTNGKVDQYEVPSKTDSRAALIERMKTNQKSLGDSAGSIDIVDIK